MRAFAFLRLAVFIFVFSSLGAGPAWADRPSSMSPRTIALPSGPSSMKGLGESFAPNPSTGVGNFAIPIDLPPGLARPSLAIQYTNGKGRSDLGASFHLPVLNIYRTKDKGSPAFNESDRFAVASGDLNDELVLVNDEKHYYRLKNEGAFALFVRDPREDTWTIRMPNGDRAFLGTDEQSRQVSTRRGVYRWFVRAFEDPFGDRAEYDYETDEGYVYLKSIRYQLHAAGYENSVELTREPRQDSFTDYSYGSPSKCRKRVSRIDVYSGCGLGCRRLLRSYALGYEQTTTSLLASVQMFGEGGSAFTPSGDTMPPLLFSYVAASRSLGRTVAMPQSLPLDLVATGRAQFDDVNGDGLPDLLVGEARNYSYYENRTGYAWSDANALARSPDVSLDDESNGATLADVNGDGFRDVLRSSTQGYSYYPGGNVQGARFLAYLPPVPLGGASNQPMRWTDPLYRLADLNFDGRTDLLTTSGAHAVSLFNVAAFGQETLQTVPGGNLPQDVARLFNDPSLQMLDFNGDGTQDFVANEISWGSDSRLRVFYGLGEGAYLDPKVIAAPKGNPGDFFLVDLNNDGYTDLLKYTGQQIVYWLGAGDERLLGPYGPNYAWSAPSRADVRSVQFMDMDGSGTVDLVLLTKTNKVVYVNLFTNPSIGLLSKIDNGIGMVTEIAYRSSTEYAIDAKLAGKPWRTTLPKPVAVISEVKVTDSLDKIGLPAQVQRTTFEYGDGYYDGKEREFRGFGYVKVTADGDDHAEARVTETWMSVGKDPVTGEDQEILKGKPIREVVSDGNGGIYTSNETKWEPGWLCAEDGPELHDILPSCALYPNKALQKDHLVARAYATAVLHGAWEKTATPKYTLERRVHDVWGTATQTFEYGEVAFRAPRSIGDPFAVEDVDPFVGEDERVEVSQVIYDIDKWMIGATARTEVRDARTNALVGASELYYDGAPFEGLPLGQIQRGKVSRNRRWLAEQNRFVDGMRYAHDDHGQVLETLDPIGNHGTIAYDAATGTFPVREVVDTATGSLVFEATYDTGLGAVLSSSDPNGAITQYRYDGLGRLRAIVDAQSSQDLPSLIYDYEYGTPESPVSTVTERHLVDRGQRSYRNAWHYSDGLGRARLAKVAGAAPGSYIATGWVEYSPSGAEAHHFEEYATTSLGLEPPPSGTASTESTYDALGRVIDVYPAETGAGRTFLRTRYLPFETQVFDEEDTSEGTWLYPATTRSDGLGRVRDIVKYNDYATTAGGSRLRTELKWSFHYNDSGSVTSWTDPKGIGRSYAYDSIGRLTDLQDPNLGPIHYDYDDANNLVRRVDALGQERQYQYGSGNRLLNVAIRKDARGAADYEYKYHYDAADPRGPIADATNLKGRLAWVEWPTGSAHYSFDTLGRALKETDSLWDPARSAFEQQTRDVFTKERDYDAAGDVLRTRLPGGRTFAAAYDARGLLQSVSAVQNGGLRPLVSGVQYDLEGKVRRTENGNGTVGCAWYNARSETVAVAAGPRTALTCDEDPTHKIQGTFQHLDYHRTAARTIDRVTDLSVDGNLPRLDAEYTYDRLHELTWARTDKGTDGYEYDAVQNLIRHTSTVPNAKAVVGDLTYAENGAGPSMVTRAGGTSYAYDAVGNLRAYNGYTLEWNGENKLVAARKPDGPTIHYHYDFAGERRITVVERPGKAPEVQREVFDEYQSRNGEDVWMVGAGHTGVEITQRPGEAEEVRYAHKDHLTGTTHLTDESGTLVGFSEYAPYGEVRTHIGSKPMLYGFAGARAEADEDLGLVRFGARYYAPALAHWASADTFIGESPEKILAIPLETNLYAYASNNPISLIDPLGSDSWYGAAWSWGSKFTVGVAKGAYGAAKETVQGAVQVVTHPVDTAVAVYDAGRAVVHDPVGSAKRAATGIYHAGVEVVDTIASGDPDRIGQLGGKVLFEVGATVVGAKLATATTGLARTAIARVGRAGLGVVARVGGTELAVAAAEAAPRVIAKAGEGIKRITRVCSGHCGLPGGVCFLGGTLVQVPSGVAAIETLRLGQRVLTMGPEDYGPTEVDATWRVVQLEMPNPDGSDDILEIDILRSPEWIRAHGFIVGEWVDFVLDDMGIRGPARVVGILSAPRIEPGPGRIITATVTHENAYVRELVLRDSGETLQLTDMHRLYSADRDAWVPAVELEEGERVWTRDGADAIASSTALIGRYRVYNLEVDSKHEYFVSRAGVRSHNSGACRAAARAAMKDMGLEGINLAKKSFNAGRKMLEKAGFELSETTATGRKVFRNAKTGAEVFYDSGDALVGAQKPHWHIRDKGGLKYDRAGRVVSGSENAGHIPGQ